MSQQDKLSGKVFWVTGASSGIGKALVEKLDKLGAKVILSSRRQDVLDTIKQTLLVPTNHHILVLDLADSGEFEQVVEDAWNIHGHIDFLINNGGISQRSLCLETEEAVDRKVMEIDYFGTIRLTKFVAKKMVSKGDGTIVSISSIAGKVGSPFRSAYSGAKHALIGFMDCLRAEISQFGIRILVVCPGWVQTNVSRNALTGDMSKFGKLDEEIASGMPIDVFVDRLIKVISSDKEEAVIATGLPLLAYHARRLLPNRFHLLIRKIYKKK